MSKKNFLYLQTEAVLKKHYHYTNRPPTPLPRILAGRHPPPHPRSRRPAPSTQPPASAPIPAAAGLQPHPLSRQPPTPPTQPPASALTSTFFWRRLVAAPWRQGGSCTGASPWPSGSLTSSPRCSCSAPSPHHISRRPYPRCRPPPQPCSRIGGGPKTLASKPRQDEAQPWIHGTRATPWKGHQQQQLWSGLLHGHGQGGLSWKVSLDSTPLMNHARRPTRTEDHRFSDSASSQVAMEVSLVWKKKMNKKNKKIFWRGYLNGARWIH